MCVHGTAAGVVNLIWTSLDVSGFTCFWDRCVRKSQFRLGLVPSNWPSVLQGLEALVADPNWVVRGPAIMTWETGQHLQCRPFGFCVLVASSMRSPIQLLRSREFVKPLAFACKSHMFQCEQTL